MKIVVSFAGWFIGSIIIGYVFEKMPEWTVITPTIAWLGMIAVAIYANATYFFLRWFHRVTRVKKA